MRALSIAVGVCLVELTLSGCQTSGVPYTAGVPYNENYDYEADPVYNIGYYGYRPYDWTKGYYSEDGWQGQDRIVRNNSRSYAVPENTIYSTKQGMRSRKKG